MKTIVFWCAAIVGLCGSVAFALDPMGPPKADLAKGQWNVGVEYSYSDMDFLRKVASWSDAKQTVSVDMQKIFANIGYGLSDNVVGFVRLGSGQGDFDRTADWTKWNGDGDWDFSWGGGFKATLVDDDNLDWGVLGQFSNGTYSGDMKASDDGTPGGYKVEMYEIQIAVGPTYQVSDCFQIYGGPFFHFISGEYNDIKEGDSLYKPIEEDSCFGGYVGASLKLADNTVFNLEYMDTGDAWAVATGIGWKF